VTFAKSCTLTHTHTLQLTDTHTVQLTDTHHAKHTLFHCGHIPNTPVFDLDMLLLLNSSTIIQSTWSTSHGAPDKAPLRTSHGAPDILRADTLNTCSDPLDMEAHHEPGAEGIMGYPYSTQHCLTHETQMWMSHSEQYILSSTHTVLSSTDRALSSTHTVLSSTDRALSSTHTVLSSSDRVLSSTHTVLSSTHTVLWEHAYICTLHHTNLYTNVKLKKGLQHSIASTILTQHSRNTFSRKCI